MSDPLIRQNDHYIVLEHGEKEIILSTQETLEWLMQWINKLESIPKDLEDQPTLKEKAQRLLETACELQIDSGITVQWFAIRIKPPTKTI